MITKEQALETRHGETIHAGQCNVRIGEQGGIHITQVRARVSGKCKTWKKRPHMFQLPIKHGLYQNGYINEQNADGFHRECDCLLITDPWLKMITEPIIGNAHDDGSLMTDLREYIMDSRNELDKRAAAVRRMGYVVGVHPPRVPNDMLVKQEVYSFVHECYGFVEEAVVDFPNFDIKELE